MTNSFVILAAAFLSLPAACSQTFEIVSVKERPAATGPHDDYLMPYRGGRLSGDDITLKTMIAWACRVEDFQVGGGPAWIGTARFDLEARSAGHSDTAQYRQMLAALLAERFKLAIRREEKESAVYILSPAKGGSKLRPSSEAGCEEDSKLSTTHPYGILHTVPSGRMIGYRVPASSIATISRLSSAASCWIARVSRTKSTSI
jgi:uncharacterized protein (TIGR03435 family)